MADRQDGDTMYGPKEIVEFRTADGNQYSEGKCPARLRKPSQRSSLRLAVGGYRSPNRDFVAKFSADLFDGGPDLDRAAALAKLGGSILARLIVVSNRVAVPSRDGGNLAGGLAVCRALAPRADDEGTLVRLERNGSER